MLMVMQLLQLGTMSVQCDSPLTVYRYRRRRLAAGRCAELLSGPAPCNEQFCKIWSGNYLSGYS